MSAVKGCDRKISNQGSFMRPVLVDEGDLHLFTTYNWSDNGNGYLRAYDKATGKNIYLHRLIAGAKDRWDIVDHINRDTYDCRRGNLRITTQSENLRNNHRRAAVREWAMEAA